MNDYLPRLPSLLCLVWCLSGCGKGELDLSIADAPVDEAEAVVIEIAGVEFQPVDGAKQDVEFSTPKSLNLLDYANGDSASLLRGELLDTGDYIWLRLIVNAQDGVRDSYIIVNGSEYELNIPADAEAGLTITRTFSIAHAATRALTIDFDLRKSVRRTGTDPTGYELWPSLRWVDNAKQGSLAGTVDPGVIASVCTIGDKPAVYLFSAGVTAPDDVDDIAPDPIATASVPQDGVYAYTLAFLDPGTYVASFTCDAAADQPDSDDDAIEFSREATVEITAGAVTGHDFVP